ncbi:maleylpyruvate isomerase family mycothiol-dependent enzyme [Nonomuraea sp. SBT364]|uniref:maleylpyruvate isomerase family mycothiol-dependent enzyme n=1 Tax=Nonomuraea sp. SBT364 TaxID=1580530 RepID=UPI00069F5E46|nr:maleylpyruvate isomerase family mycothiol-dependent enzyme [Nonomuraea sp. SBT364]
MTVLQTLRAELTEATSGLLATAASLSDADVAAPSRLPGWSRGHVLTHLARNADSHVNLLTWARTGVPTPQYPDLRARTAGIEAGAHRPAAGQLADLRESAARLDAAVDALPEAAWRAQVGGLRPPHHPAWYVLVRRLRELGMHHVDLGAGYGPADWPETFVRRELHDCLRTWPYDRSTVSAVRLLAPADPAASRPGEDGPGEDGRASEWRELGDGPMVEGTPVDVLAWLTGRSAGEGVKVVPGGRACPPPPPWLTTTAPADLPATPPKDYP